MTAGSILAFDTATQATAVALADAAGVVREARDDPLPGQRPRHASRLLALCSELLERAGIDFQDLDRLAVGIGPGTFTGLRIGVATARTLAQATGRPLVGVSTLQSLAVNVLAASFPEDVATVAAVLDARRSEAFAAAWRRDQLAQLAAPVLPPAAFTPESLAQWVTALQPPVLALGEGAVKFRMILERSGAFVPDDQAHLHRVSAASHCRIARQLPGADPDQIVPQYLRLPDAEIARLAARKQ